LDGFAVDDVLLGAATDLLLIGRRGPSGAHATASIVRGRASPADVASARGPAAQGVGGARKHDRAVLVGACGRAAGRREDRQQTVGRMPVAVVGADRHDRNARAGRGVQRVELVARAVVSDLDDVDGEVVAEPEQPPLRLFAQVTEGEERQARLPAREAGPGEHREAARIALEARGRAAAPPLGPQRTPFDVAGRPGIAARDVHDLSSPGGERADAPLAPGLLGVGEEDGAHPADERRRGAHVVVVEVREHEHVDHFDRELVEARGEQTVVGARVDEGDGAGAAHDERVALADVAGGDAPVGREGRLPPHDPADGDARDDGRGAADRRGARDHEQPAAPRPARPQADRRDRGCREQREEEQAREPLGPGDARARPRRRDGRDGADPLRRQPGDPRDRERDGRSDGCQQAGDDADPRRDRRRRPREEVREHAVGRHVRVEEHEQGLAGELRGGGHGDREREAPRHPSREALGDGAGEAHEAGGGERGEREAGVAGEPRIAREEHDDGDAQERDAADAPSRRLDEERDRGHGARPDDAPLRDHECGEGGERRESAGESDAARRAREPPDEEHGPDDEGAVRTGDGREVRERRGLHVVLQRGLDEARVADGQAGQELSARAGQRADDIDEAAALRVRPGDERRRLSRHRAGRAGEGEHGVARPGLGGPELRIEGDWRPDAGRAHPFPIDREASEDEGGHVHLVAAAVDDDSRELRPELRARRTGGVPRDRPIARRTGLVCAVALLAARAAGAHDERVVVEDAGDDGLQRDDRALCGGLRHDRRIPRRGVRGGARGDERDRRERECRRGGDERDAREERAALQTSPGAVADRVSRTALAWGAADRGDRGLPVRPEQAAQRRRRRRRPGVRPCRPARRGVAVPAPRRVPPSPERPRSGPRPGERSDPEPGRPPSRLRGGRERPR